MHKQRQVLNLSQTWLGPRIADGPQFGGFSPIPRSAFYSLKMGD